MKILSKQDVYTVIDGENSADAAADADAAGNRMKAKILRFGVKLLAGKN